MYFIAFFPMGINLLTSYYLQSVLNTKKSLCISLLRNIILSGIAILVFPLLFGGNSLWLVMPVVEVIVFMVSIVFLNIKWWLVDLEKRRTSDTESAGYPAFFLNYLILNFTVLFLLLVVGNRENNLHDRQQCQEKEKGMGMLIEKLSFVHNRPLFLFFLFIIQYITRITVIQGCCRHCSSSNVVKKVWNNYWPNLHKGCFAC